jgi:hypothetical protein
MGRNTIANVNTHNKAYRNAQKKTTQKKLDRQETLRLIAKKFNTLDETDESEAKLADFLNKIKKDI